MTSWTSTASSSRRTRRTSTNCWTRWPSVPPPRSGSATACPPDQRAELDALAQQAFGSPSLMNALNRLDSHLQAARPGEDWAGSSAVLRRQSAGHGGGRAGAGRYRRARAARRAAVAKLLRRDDGRRRPRHAGPPTRRRCRGRRAHAGRAGTRADRIRASWTVAPTASGGCRRRRCGSWVRRRYAMWRNNFRDGTANGTPAAPARPAS